MAYMTFCSDKFRIGAMCNVTLSDILLNTTRERISGIEYPML